MDYQAFLSIADIEAWVLLFDTEASLSGYTRKLYDSWRWLLVQQFAHSTYFEPVQKVRLLMMARLPLDSSCGMFPQETWKKIEEKALLLWNGDPVPNTRDNQATFALVCQDLRLPYEEQDKLVLLVLEQKK